jgi:hypothetical protein
LRRFSIGGAELRDEAAIVGPLPWASGSAHPNAPVGLTGFEFFAEFRATIDYERRLLRFEALDSPPPPGTRLRFSTDEHDIYVTAKVNGRPGLFRIDTGDGGTITLFRTFAAYAGLSSPAQPRHSIAGGVGGDLAVTSVRLTRFQLADETLEGIKADVSQTTAGSFASRTIAGNLGAKLLHCFTLSVDFQTRMLTLGKTATTKACLGALTGG